MDRQQECEAKLIYSVIVAGKNAKFADEKTRSLLALGQEGETPFAVLRRLIKENSLEATLKTVRTGNYTKLAKCFRAMIVSSIDFENCQPWDLEKIHGIGPKTSRFFIMWIRPEAEFAALDVHVLRWLNSIGIKAPRSTPSSPKVYAELEKLFLAEAKKRGKLPRELDMEIWSAGGRKNNV